MTHPHTWDLFRDVALTIAGACLFWCALAWLVVDALETMR